MGVYYFLEKKPDLLRWLFFVFFVSFAILIIDGFGQYFLKTNFFDIAIEKGRITSLFGSEHILGSYLSRLFPIFLAITFLLYKNNKKYILAISLLFILIEILIFLSGERSAFFFNTLAAIFVIMMLKDFKKIRFLSFIISIGLIFLITIIDDSAKKRIWDQTINQIGINSKNLNLFSEGHESHYKSAYKMFEDNRVFGIGIRNFRNFCNDKKYRIDYKNIIIPYKIYHDRSCTTHPHNTYIQLLSETGLIGFSFIFLLLIYFIYKVLEHLVGIIRFKKYYFNDFEVCLLSAILITIWPLVPSGNFFNNWLSIIYYFPVGFLLWSFKKSKRLLQ
jgi:O-antigen ligase